MSLETKTAALSFPDTEVVVGAEKLLNPSLRSSSAQNWHTQRCYFAPTCVRSRFPHQSVSSNRLILQCQTLPVETHWRVCFMTYLHLFLVLMQHWLEFTKSIAKQMKCEYCNFVFDLIILYVHLCLGLMINALKILNMASRHIQWGWYGSHAGFFRNKTLKPIWEILIVHQ